MTWPPLRLFALIAAAIRFLVREVNWPSLALKAAVTGDVSVAPLGLFLSHLRNARCSIGEAARQACFKDRVGWEFFANFLVKCLRCVAVDDAQPARAVYPPVIVTRKAIVGRGLGNPTDGNPHWSN